MPDNPELQAALERARHHVMTPAERDAQRRSWVRGEMMLDRPEMTADEANALMDKAGEPRPTPAAAVEARKWSDAATEHALQWPRLSRDAAERSAPKVSGEGERAEILTIILDHVAGLRAALPHLAAPAGDVADADRWKAAVNRYQDRLQALCGRHGCLPGEERVGWIDRRLGELAAERDAAILARDTVIQDTLAGITPWLECERRMKAAEAANTALLTGERVIVPQTRQHAESLYAVAVSSLRAYGVDPDAERDTQADPETGEPKQ